MKNCAPNVRAMSGMLSVLNTNPCPTVGLKNWYVTAVDEKLVSRHDVEPHDRFPRLYGLSHRHPECLVDAAVDVTVVEPKADLLNMAGLLLALDMRLERRAVREEGIKDDVVEHR